jgi:hypothetical protein
MKNFVFGFVTSLLIMFVLVYFGLFPKAESQEVVSDQTVEDVVEVPAEVNEVVVEPVDNDLFVSIVVPVDLEKYGSGMNEFLFGPTDASSPVDNFEFIEKEVVVELANSDLMRLAVGEATAVGLLGGGPERGAVKYLEVQAGVAYVVLDIDEDAWSGSSISIGKIRPLVEKTLLKFDEVDEVVFGYSSRSKRNAAS